MRSGNGSLVSPALENDVEAQKAANSDDSLSIYSAVPTPPGHFDLNEAWLAEKPFGQARLLYKLHLGILGHSKPPGQYGPNDSQGAFVSVGQLSWFKVPRVRQCSARVVSTNSISFK